MGETRHMPSLAQVTRETRIIAKFGGIGVVVLLFLFFSYKGIVFINNVINPPKIAPPGEELGEVTTTLPVSIDQPTYTYQINTITGKLPVFPNRLRVYKMLAPEPDLLALQKARESARIAGFTQSEVLVGANVYSWANNSGGSITYDIIAKTFQLSSGIGYTSTGYTFSSNVSLGNKVTTYIRDLNASTDDLTSTPKIVYFRSAENSLIPESNSGLAHIARVDFKQNDVKVDQFRFVTDTSQLIEALPIYYEDPTTTNQTFMVKAGYNSQIQIISGIYSHFPVDYTQFGMYPLKSSTTAFTDLQAGKSFIVKKPSGTSIDITNVKLGYFIPKTAPEFLVPIYIFEGKDFMAYVDALRGKVVSSPTP